MTTATPNQAQTADSPFVVSAACSGHLEATRERTHMPLLIANAHFNPLAIAVNVALHGEQDYITLLMIVHNYRWGQSA